jgi:3-oxoadipate enol-lactonase
LTLELSCGGVDYAYSDVGRRDGAPPVLLLHGLLVSSKVWAPQARKLAETRRVLALDWPGHGASPPMSRRATLDEIADAVIEIFDRSGIRRAALVGLSFGGIVALRVAFRHSERVDAAVLVSTPRALENDDQRTRHLETLSLAERIGKGPVLRGMAARLFGPTTRRERPELVTEWLEEAERIDLGSVRLLSEAAIDRPETPALAAGAPRTLVVRGDDDALVTRSDSEELAKVLEGAAFVPIREAGHWVPLEKSEALTETLVSFLEPRSRDCASL